MKIRKHCVILVLLIASLMVAKDGYAQINTDSLRAKQRFQQELEKRDSILNAAKEARKKDSLNRVIQKQQALAFRDSLRQAMVERRRMDSIKREEIKAELKEKRRQQDSTRLARQAEMKRVIEERKRQSDSLRIARKRITDSISTARAEAKKIRDALRKYKNSKGYKDSVAQVRQVRKDSIKLDRDRRLAKIKAERKSKLDSIKAARTTQIAKVKAERKRILDSTMAARTAFNDSLRAARKRITDKLKLVRSRIKDSLEQLRNKSKIAKKKKQTETEMLKEEAEKIHARKKGSWTNEKLLKKPWNIKRRIWQNTVTRYNAYYNANRKYDDALKKLKNRHKEIYTEQIYLHPYDINNGLTMIGGDMDTVVKKCAYDAHIHDPRSKWFDNAYHLMGRAFYFKNDYESAITAFQYVVNEYKDGNNKKKRKKGFVKLPALDEIKFDKKNKITLATLENRKGLKVLAHHPIRNQSLVWLARAYTKNQQFGEAQSIINILEEDKQFPDRLLDELYIAQAELDFEQGNDISAIEPLEKAVKQKGIDKEMRNRINYLLAQLYAKDGNMIASNKYLQKALKSKLPLEMEYFTKLALAQNAMNGNGNTDEAIVQLESLIKNDKFEKWRAQSYLSLGQILQNSKPEKAIEYFTSSITQENNKELKAAAFLGIGEINYKQAKYAVAKTAYDSVITFASAANPPLKNMDNIKLRKEVLGSLVEFTTIIKLEDSLQSLSKKSKKEQMAVIKKELKRQQKERRKKMQEESAKLVAVALTPGKFGKNDWYFYNNRALQTGMIEFKTKWGDRQLTDNWRRSAVNNAQGGNFAFGSDSSGNNQEEDLTRNAEARKMLNDLYSSPTDFEKSDDKIRKAYFQLGLIYSSRLQEYKSSINTFEAMNRRYAKHKQLAASYYSMNLSHKKLNEIPQAKIYADKLNAEFPNSQFAKLLNGNGPEADKESLRIATLYDSAYQMLVRDEYQNALKNATASLSEYPDNILKPKFELIKAKSLAGLQKFDSSIVVTENIIKSFPGTDEEKYAMDFMGYLVKANQLGQGVQAAIGKSDSNKSVDNSNPFSTAVYTYNKYERHMFVIYLSSIDGKTLGLKAGFSDFNRIKHAQKRLKTNMNLLPGKAGTGMISIVDFKNAEMAKRYLIQALKEPNLLNSVSTINYKTMIISKSNFKELRKTGKISTYLAYYKSKYK